MPLTVRNSLVLPVLVLSSCIGPAPGPEVAQLSQPLVGGRDIAECRFPAAAHVGSVCTGFLLHPNVVVYAAHCGTGHSTMIVGGQRFGLRECSAFPSDNLIGADIAYCLLDRPADVAVVPPALGCEQDLIEAGLDAWLVGFGATGAEGVHGMKVEAHGRVTSVGDEIVVDGEGVGTCVGDSGGPLFTPLVDRHGHLFWRVIGVLSSGTRGCAPGTSYYTPLAPFVAWLEDETGLDLSPCGTVDGQWRPGPGCRDGNPLDEANCRATDPGPWSDTCGAPFEPEGDDDTPPELDVIASAWSSDVSLELTARDTGWGLAGLSAWIEDAHGVTVWSEAVPGGDISRSLALADGSYILHAVATDQAYNTSRLAESIEVRAAATRGDCGVRPGVRRASHSGWAAALVLVVVGATRRRWQRATHEGKAARRSHRAWCGASRSPPGVQ